MSDSMKLNTQGVTGERAWELSKWCSESANSLRDFCRSSDRTARKWWENEIDRPEELAAELGPREDMLSFANRLQAEGYEWAGEAGSLFAEERGIDATVSVDRFTPADDDDGPFEGEEKMTRSPAVALRFEFDEELSDFLKGVLGRVRCARGGRGRPLSKMPFVGGWSKSSRCWWVLSTYWQEVRQALLDKDIMLAGPLANPRTVKEGFFARQQVWDVKKCEWR